MHAPQSGPKPQWHLSNTATANIRVGSSSRGVPPSGALAELVQDDDDTLPLPHTSSSHAHDHRHRQTSRYVNSALPELRPTTSSFSSRPMELLASSPILPGEHPVKNYPRHHTNVTASPRPPSTVRWSPKCPPSRLDRTIDRLSQAALRSEASISPRFHTASARTPAPTVANTASDWGQSPPVDQRTDEAQLEQIRQGAAMLSPSTIPRFLPLSTKQALQYLQYSIRALVTARGAGDLGSVPSLLLTTYNIVCKQVFHDKAVIVHTQDSATAQQPQSLFDTFAYGGEETTIATELRDLQRELLLTKKHYHVAIQQIDIFKHRLSEHVAEIRRLEKALDQANAAELDLRGNISQLQQTIQIRGMEVSELKSNIVALHSSMHDVQKNDHAKISERTADLRHELVSLYEQVRQSEEMSKSYEREISNLNGDVQRTEEKFEESQRRLAEVLGNLTSRDDEIYGLRLAAIEQGKKMAALEVNVEDLLVVQGDTMLQDKMMKENGNWAIYKDAVLAEERARQLEDAVIPSHIKFIRGFGVDDSIPLWLRAEGKVRPKFLNKADTVHMALQALTDLCLPASIAGSTRALLARSSQSGPLNLGGTPSVVSRGRRDDAALGSIGMPSGQLGPNNVVGVRRSVSGGGGGANTDVSLADMTSRLPFSDAFKCWLSRSGTDNLNNKQGTELAYGFHHSMQRWADDPDMVLFNAIMRSDVPPEIHYQCYRSLDDVLQLFVAADEEMYKGEVRKSLPITTVARVLKKAVSVLPAAYATEQDAEQLLFLLTLAFNVPYVPYRSLFEYEEDGGRNLFLKAYFELVVSRTLEYYDTLQTLAERLGEEALLQRRSSLEAAADDAGQGHEKVTDALSKPEDSISVSESRASPRSDWSDGDHTPVSFPGHGHPTRPVPEAIRDVVISLDRFGALWCAEDPAKSEEMVELLALLRVVMLAAEAKAKADEEAAAQQVATTRGRGGRSAIPVPTARRGTTTAKTSTNKVDPLVAADAPARDTFTVGQVVTAMRQLCLVRSSHRLLPSTLARRSSNSGQPFSAAGGDGTGTPAAAKALVFGDADDPSPDCSDDDGPLSTTVAPNSLLPVPLASRDLGASSFPSEHQMGHTSPASVSVAELSPPQPIEPRFSLEKFVSEHLRMANTPGRSNSNRLFGGTASATIGSFREHGSIASQSLSGGGLGVAHSRAHLQALAKRTQTVLPPFFKARLLRH